MTKNVLPKTLRYADIPTH